MEHKILIAGFGGQGVMLMGQLMGYSACEHGKSVTFFPSYGAEQRGGTANCSVVVSDEEVGAPNPRILDTVVIMNEPSLAKFAGRVKRNGSLIVNGDLVRNVPDGLDANIYSIPVVSIAREIGNPKVANMVMAGAIIELTGILPETVVAKVAEKKLGKSPELVAMNNEALRKGMEYGKKLINKV